MGAFVSGLDAGKIYQTWPLMGNGFFPNDLYFDTYSKILEFDNHSLVQFYHRNLAYLILIYVIFLSIFIYKKKLKNLYNPLKLVFFFSFFTGAIRNFDSNKWSKYLFGINTSNYQCVIGF